MPTAMFEPTEEVMPPKNNVDIVAVSIDPGTEIHAVFQIIPGLEVLPPLNVNPATTLKFH